MTRRIAAEDVAKSSNRVSEEATIGEVESTSRTQRKILELVSRIGKKPLKVFIDSGYTGNYISAQECTASGLHIYPGRAYEREELRMENGLVVKI